MSGNYVPPDRCYGVKGDNIQDVSKDFAKAYDELTFDNGKYSIIAPGVYENIGKISASFSGKYYNALAANIRPPFQQVNHHGTDESYGGFFNVIYDFDLERLFGLKSIATPFIGGGAGYLWQRYNRPNTMIGAITGTHGGFSWQGIIGVAFDTGISGLQITAQYRMIGQPGSFYNGGFAYNVRQGVLGNANFDQRFNHQFIVGFRYAFHNRPVHIAPPSVSRAFAAAAAAAPAPVPARSYLVFFDWNQYALTSRARQIVVEAAHATSYVHTTRINVNGYTDSSAAPGPAGQKYNYALSVKRARSVEAELIRNGVPASEIVIRGYGDTNPLVPTAPNTREPQNRRVEIILHA
ncbi:MAG: OmpA family protein [Acetobacter sp.]|nr:OmpA family protein [Acetobacter sp.]